MSPLWLNMSPFFLKYVSILACFLSTFYSKVLIFLRYVIEVVQRKVEIFICFRFIFGDI